MPSAPSSASASASAYSALGPPRPSAGDGHRRFAAGKENGAGRGVACERGVHAREIARLALQRIAQDDGRVAGLARHIGGGGERHGGRRHDQGLRACEPGVALLRRLVPALLEVADDGGGLVDPVLAEHRKGVGEGGGVGHGRARADHCGIVPRHVGNQEAHEASRMACRPQPPALDGGKMLAHGVDLADCCARAEQRAGDRLLVASAIPGAGRVSSAEPPPETRQSARSSAPSPSAMARMRAAASRPPASGTGCAASTTSIARVGTRWPYRVTTRPSRGPSQ